MCTTFTTQNLTSTTRWKMPTLCTHTLTHLSAWGGQQGLPVLFKALSEAAAVGKEMWAAEGRLRGGSQMKGTKPFRSARTSPSFPEAEAAILIFLKLAKKDSPYLHWKLCIQYSTSPHSAAILKHTCRLLQGALVLIFHQQSLGRQGRGSAPFFKPLRSSAGWERCVSWRHLGM